MFWLKIIPDLLGIINYFIKQAQRKGYINEGYQKRIDEQLAELNQSMQTVATIRDRINRASDPELAELLKQYGVDEILREAKKPEREGGYQPSPMQSTGGSAKAASPPADE